MAAFPTGTYKVIVVDPPWPLARLERKVRPNQLPTLDYPIMSLEEITALPVASIADRDSVCFLWAIQRFLPDAFGVLKAWGFKYQRTITWDKGNGMSLFGFHHRSEFVLFGYRGHLEMWPRRPTFPTVFSAKSPRHSAKPDLFYEMAAAFGEPRIDLFARGPRDGYSIWGAEAVDQNPT